MMLLEEENLTQRKLLQSILLKGILKTWKGYAIKYPENVSHLVIANSFHSFLMWQENCDNSNHEIKTNYPEVWEELMEGRLQGAVSSDSIHYEIYGRAPYGFLFAYNPENC